MQLRVKASEIAATLITGTIFTVNLVSARYWKTRLMTVAV